jgi:hypothetical protein
MQSFTNKIRDGCMVIANVVYLGFECEHEFVVASFVYM